MTVIGAYAINAPEVKDHRKHALPQAQIDATFPHVAAMRMAMDTPAYPTGSVCKASRHYVDLMDYRAVVLWQDFAVLKAKMPDNRVFAIAPFCDNSSGFFDFVALQSAAVAAFPTETISQAARDAQERGDRHTSEVLSRCVPLFAAAQQNSLAGGIAAASFEGDPRPRHPQPERRAPFCFCRSTPGA